MSYSAGGNVDVEERRDLGDAHAPGHGPRAVALRDDGRRLVLVLVRDLAHELLDEVLERREAGHGAVLVDDDREGLAPAAEVREERRDRLGLRREEDLARERARRRGRVRPAEDREDVLDVDDPDGLVDRALDEREARELRLHEEVGDLVERRVRLARRRCPAAAS